ncbi:conserved protein of unknown function [Rhodovastum atsumiense]|uniref:Uncharacterized protein n=1 Tax=Rhodovastum atsumiense TaxID=504468 RepID=A0A5M6IPT4_9PROT|nr:hypothetical protein [Rhodovastum atsumiense]KAA5610271.1 hypothetical protein F1189_20025 [Rhodovastum atsumiense]CAH2602243.1 conserved protein of unknown function [Rhodovastum atsumiense]
MTLAGAFHIATKPIVDLRSRRRRRSLLQQAEKIAQQRGLLYLRAVLARHGAVTLADLPTPALELIAASK